MSDVSSRSLAEIPATPLLTVLIPTRNRWGLLAAQCRAVDQILREKDASFEIIVHDNSTEPPPPGLVEALPGSVRYIRSPEMYDTAEENICAAFGHCVGEYVWLLADDDGLEINGVAELLTILKVAEEDIIVFNSRHGRDERLAAEGAYVTQRARRLFYEKEMRCSIGDFVERTGFFYWICAISTVIVRRSAAPVEPLRKYLEITRIYAHVAWLIEIGKDKRFLFVNRPLVVYGLLPTDHDGGRHWRSIGVREGAYSNAIWTGLWLRALDELLARGALTLSQIRRAAEMNHATRFHFATNLVYQVLEQLGEMPELPPRAHMQLIGRWLVRLFPGAIFLGALYEDATAFAIRHGAPLIQLEEDSRNSATIRLLARDLRERLSWWRRAIADTPWYVQFYVETLHLYDIYDFGSDWVAAHTSFSNLPEALEVIDLPSLAPAFLRAASYDALRRLIESQPSLAAEALQAARSATFALPNQWSRLALERPEGGPGRVEVTVAPAQPLPSQGEEIGRLRAELARQDVQLAEAYAEASVSAKGLLGRLFSRGRAQESFSAPTAPFLDMDRKLYLNDGEAIAYMARGFAPPESWGCWTDGPVAVFRCRHPAKMAAADFEFWPQMVWPREGRPCVVGVAVNGGRPRRRVLQANRPEIVALTPRQMSSPELEITFHLHAPKRADEEPVSDPRQLGLGLAAVRLSWREGV